MSAPRLKRDANTGIQYVHWTDGARSKRVSTGERDEDKAQIFLANWMLVKHSAPAELADEFFVRDLWTVYCQKHAVAGAETRDWIWKNLKEHFADLKLSQIDDACVDAYVAHREAGRIGRPSQSPTIRRELVALRACINWCAHRKRKLIRPEQAPIFDLPPDGEPRDRWLRTEEIQKVMRAATERRTGTRLSRAERFLWIALETAARKQAVLDLTWDRVDFETGVIDFNVPGRKRTSKRRTAVPISKALRPVLERAFAERESKFVLDHDGDIDRTVARIGAQAGVAGVTPHVLRHSSATHMARNGVSLWLIAGILGNSVKMVENVYAKHCPDRLREAVDQISGGMLEQAE